MLHTHRDMVSSAIRVQNRPKSPKKLRISMLQQEMIAIIYQFSENMWRSCDVLGGEVQHKSGSDPRVAEGAFPLPKFYNFMYFVDKITRRAREHKKRYFFRCRHSYLCKAVFWHPKFFNTYIGLFVVSWVHLDILELVSGMCSIYRWDHLTIHCVIYICIKL